MASDLFEGEAPTQAHAATLPRRPRAALPGAIEETAFEPEPEPERHVEAARAEPRWRAEPAWSIDEILAARDAVAEPEPASVPGPRRADDAALEAAMDFEAWFGSSREEAGLRDETARRDDADSQNQLRIRAEAESRNAGRRGAAPLDMVGQFAAEAVDAGPSLHAAEAALSRRGVERQDFEGQDFERDKFAGDPFADEPFAGRRPPATNRMPDAMRSTLENRAEEIADRAEEIADRAEEIADRAAFVAQREPSAARRTLDDLRRRRAEQRQTEAAGRGAADPTTRRREPGATAPRRGVQDRLTQGAAGRREQERAASFKPARADDVFVDDAQFDAEAKRGLFGRARDAGLAASHAARQHSATARRAVARASLGRKLTIGAAALAVAGLISYAVSPRSGSEDLLASIAPRVNALLTPSSVSGVRPGVVFVDSKFDIVTREEGKSLEVWGMVANNGPEIALTPTIEIVSRGENGEALQRWLAIPEKDQLNPGETSRFTARMMNPDGPVFDVDLYIANHR